MQSVVFIPDLRMMIMLMLMLRMRMRIMMMMRRIMVIIMKRGHYGEVIMMRLMILTRIMILWKK